MNREERRVFIVPATQTPLRRRILRRELLQSIRSGQRQVLIDFSNRHCLDADDIDLLLECAKAVMGHSVDFGVIAGSASNRALLEVARITSVLSVFQSLEDAVSVSSPSSAGSSTQANSTRGGNVDYCHSQI